MSCRQAVRPGRAWLAAAAALAALVLGGCSGSSDRPAPAPSAGGPSGVFAVEGRDLRLDCVGDGGTTMVLEVGEAAPYQSLSIIADAYAPTMRVCSYDRVATDRDIASDLHALLEVAEVPGPYFLVGHSAGGLLVLAYAAAHPDDVAGVVSINPVPPWQDWARIGLAGMSAPERQAEADYYAGANAESLDYADVSDLMVESPVPQDVPLHLLISSVAQCGSPDDACARLYPRYERIMRGIARRWGEGRFSEVDAPHDIHATDMGAVRRAIDDVVSRSSSP